MMNRKPVPEVMAKSFWVTPMVLRVCLTNSPMVLGVCFMALSYILPYGNITPLFASNQVIYSRTGIIKAFEAKTPVLFPLGNVAGVNPGQANMEGVKNMERGERSRQTFNVRCSTFDVSGLPFVWYVYFAVKKCFASLRLHRLPADDLLTRCPTESHLY
jgi:hypothetical protein